MSDEIDRVMVDIETLGTEPGCAILSIGAVRFNTDGISDEFYQSIALESCQEYGLGIDANTLEWWLGQDESVTDVLVGGEDLPDVLEEFGTFYGTVAEIWAYSPSFDCDILSEAYDSVGIVPPWNYYDERCCRTLAALPIWPDIEQDGDEHNALDDAKYQARQTIAALDEIDDQE